ncbi:MAG TPA: orotate phosphoribosyltransferase [Chthoniobacterales bacterium]|jgi:orotate phosphoribosyltransferase
MASRCTSPVTDVGQSDSREELRRLLIQKSICQGHFTLASGAQSDFYVDARVTTLDPRGATLIGKVGWDLLRKTASELGYKVDAVGGLTMGADPIALSIGITAHANNPEEFPQVFTVRKKLKEHGRHKLIEGNFAKGNSVVVIEDVITTGGSTMQAIDAIERAGGRVAFVVALVDRQEGGRAAIEARGHKVIAIFTRADLLDTRERADRATV